MLQGPGLALIGFGIRLIVGHELDSPRSCQPQRVVVSAVRKAAETDSGVKVRKMKEAPSSPDGHRVCGVQAEKPDTWSSVVLDVEPQVELWKGRKVR
jgi:hypothetical protein